MGKIKYHNNKIHPQYDSDGALADNWDPDANFEPNEYVEVHFRINSKGYGYPCFSFENQEDRTALDKELKEVFDEMGWKNEDSVPEDYICSNISSSKSKSRLYLHPQDFSGMVKKSEVKELAQAFQNRERFSLRWVDLYDDVIDISDNDYRKHLESIRDDIKKDVFKAAVTSRRNTFAMAYTIAKAVAVKCKTKRADDYSKEPWDADFTTEYIRENIIPEMLEEGLLVKYDRNDDLYIRSLNKTEQKQLKISI